MLYKSEKTLKQFCVGDENHSSGLVDKSGAAGNSNGPLSELVKAIHFTPI
jgi:hypothetical protein